MNIKNMHVVDRLGHIQAQIAELEVQEKALKAEIVALNKSEVEGDLFRATVSNSEREGKDQTFKARVDELIEKYLSAQFIRAHTTFSPITTVRVTARKGIALKVLGD